MKPLHRPKIAAFLVTVFGLILAFSLSVGATIARAETPPQISNQVYDPDNKLGSASAKVTEELSSLAEDGLEIYVAFPQDYGLLTPTDWNLKALQNTGAAANAYIVSIIADYPNQTVYLASGNDYAQLDQDRISALAQTYLEPLLNQQKYGDAVVAFAQALAKEAPEGTNGSKISPWAMVVILTLLVLVIYIFVRLFKIRRQLRASRPNNASTAVPADSTPLPSSTLNDSFEDEAPASPGSQTAADLDPSLASNLGSDMPESNLSVKAENSKAFSPGDKDTQRSNSTGQRERAGQAKDSSSESKALSNQRLDSASLSAPELSSAGSHAQPSSLTGASGQVDSKLKDKSAPDTSILATSAEKPRATSSVFSSLPVQNSQSTDPDTATLIGRSPSAYPGDAKNTDSDLQRIATSGRFSNKHDSVLNPGAVTYLPPRADDQDTATTSLSEIKEYGQNRIPSSGENQASLASTSQTSAQPDSRPNQGKVLTGVSQPEQAENTPATATPTAADQHSFPAEVTDPNAIPIIPSPSLSAADLSASSSPASANEKNAAVQGEGEPAPQPKSEPSYQARQDTEKNSVSAPANPPHPQSDSADISGSLDSAATLASRNQADAPEQLTTSTPRLNPAHSPEDLTKAEADSPNSLPDNSANPKHATPDVTPASATPDATYANTAADTTTQTSAPKATSTADNQALEFTKVVRQADNWSRRGIEKLQLAQQRFGRTETHPFALAQAEAANAVRAAFSEFASAQLEARPIRKQQIYDQLTEPIKQLQHQISQFTGQYHRQTAYANLERHFQAEITSLLGKLKASKTQLRTSGVLDSATLQRLDSDYRRAETWLSQASRLLQQARKATATGNQIEKLTVRVENLLIKANALKRLSESELLKATQHRKAEAATDSAEKLNYLLEAAAGAMASVDDYINMYTNRIGVAARTMLVLANRTLSRLDLNPNLSVPEQLRIAQRAYQQARQAQQLARNDVTKSFNDQ